MAQDLTLVMHSVKVSSFLSPSSGLLPLPPSFSRIGDATLLSLPSLLHLAPWLSHRVGWVCTACSITMSFPLCSPVILDLFQLYVPCSVLSLGPPKCNSFCWRSFFCSFPVISTNLSSVSLIWLFFREKNSWSSGKVRTPFYIFIASSTFPLQHLSPLQSLP